jgi:hypothetical protein
MPHYYFGIDGTQPDDEGEELPDDDAARAVAVKVAEELGKNLPERPRIFVYDAERNLIWTTRLHA